MCSPCVSRVHCQTLVRTTESGGSAWGVGVKGPERGAPLSLRARKLFSAVGTGWGDRRGAQGSPAEQLALGGHSCHVVGRSRFRVPGNQGCGQQNGPKRRPGHPAEGSVAPPAMRGAPPGSAGTPALGGSGGSRRMAGSASSRPGDGQSRPDPGLPTKPLALSGLRVRHVESQVTIPEAGAARRGVDTQSCPV